MSAPATPAAASAELACPECQHLITYYDVKGSEYYACPRCRSYFRYSNSRPPKVMGKYRPVPADVNLLPVGTPGVLAGRACRVVGYVRRAEARQPQHAWTEYQVYQPATDDYVQLSQFDGHWLLIRPASPQQKYQPKGEPNSRVVSTPEGEFKIYNRYQARVQFAEGEFDWDIEEDDRLWLTEYISPPLMLVQEEKSKNATKHSTWYRAEHLEPDAVAAAFGLDVNIFPAQEGVGAVQPFHSWAAIKALTVFALAVLLALQIAALIARPSAVLLRQTLLVESDPAATAGTNKVIVSPAFTLAEAAALQIELRTSLQNQWLELPVSLVNEQTGQGFEFTKNIEFYNGVEDGESWSEGNREADAVLSRVPAGRYHLNFYPVTETGVSPAIDVVVQYNPPLGSNFFLVAGLLLLYPVWQFFRRSSFEARRWSASDYSPA